MGKVVTFGEIMGRLAPAGFLRLRQAMPGALEMLFAGSEANVAVSIAQLGGQAAFVTALPKNVVADACLDDLRARGVDTSWVVRTDGGRMGMLFLETGANQRPSNVIYDRDGSSISLTGADTYPWQEIFAQANWFHVSGITPAVSRMAAEAALESVKQAKAGNLTVSCDLNFRKKLWRWDSSCQRRELAQKTMKQILPYVDVLIGNEEDAGDMLSIKAGDTDVESGKLNIDRYPEVAQKIVSQFDNISKVAITLRESVSANHNNWGAMLYDSAKKQAFFAPGQEGSYEPYQIKNIVDRVGAGDSFAAGLIFALTTPELSAPETAVSFATAASCLAHSIAGDYNFSSRSEVESLMQGSASGRVVR